MKITFDELEKMGYPSVTDYCRVLVESGTPEGTIEVYRGEMLCLTVTDIGKAAEMQPSDRGWIMYDKRRKKGPVGAQGEV